MSFNVNPVAPYLPCDCNSTVVVTDMLSGHSWERPSALSAGKGTQFLNTDTGVLTVSSGDDSIGWYVEFGGPNLRDKCALKSPGGYVKAVGDLSVFSIGKVTLASLFYWDGDTGHPYYFFAAVGTRPRGIIVGIRSVGVKWVLECYQGVDSALATFAKASFGVGWHSIAVAAVLHDFGGGNVDAWAYSLDGNAVAYVPMAAAYGAPLDGDAFVMGATDAPDSPLNGASAEVAVWDSTLSESQMEQLSTVPVTDTCHLPITQSMGVPYAWHQAERYDPRLPNASVCKIGDCSAACTVAGMTRTDYP